MKTIITSILFSGLIFSQIANGTGIFNHQIPQPDFVSNDWDGDGDPNITDPDDDNDGVDDEYDDIPFDRNNGGGSSTGAGSSLEIVSSFRFPGSYALREVMFTNNEQQLAVADSGHSSQGGLISIFDINNDELSENYRITGNGSRNDQIGQYFDISDDGSVFISRKFNSTTNKHSTAIFKRSGNSYNVSTYMDNVTFGYEMSLSRNGQYMVTSTVSSNNKSKVVRNTINGNQYAYAQAQFIDPDGTASYYIGERTLISDDGQNLITASGSRNSTNNSYNGGFFALSTRERDPYYQYIYKLKNQIFPVNNEQISELGHDELKQTDNFIYASAPKDSVGGAGSGAVYVYDKSGNPVTKIKAKEPLANSYMGRSFGVSQNDKYVAVIQNTTDINNKILLFEKKGGEYEQIASSKDITNIDLITRINNINSYADIDVSEDGYIAFGYETVYLLKIQ